MNSFDDIYNASIKYSNLLIEDIRFSRRINLNPIRECAGHMCRFLDNRANIVTLLNHVQDKNPYMVSHQVNVAFISSVIGKWMGMNNSDLAQLVFAAFLHDIGKAKIRDSILNKTDKLTESEMEIVKAHPVLGYKLLEGLNVEPEVQLGVLSHHERQDGSGYPMHLKGDEIFLYGRIIAIADTYDAITAKRAYNEKRTPFKAVEEIQAGSFGSLDPEICQCFLNNILNHYYGVNVRLNNELEGEIIYVNPQEKTRPLVRCNNEYHNLSRERNLEIVEIVEIPDKMIS